MIEQYRVREPPFPTYVLETQDNMPNRPVNFSNINSQDLTIPKLFRFSQPSIVYTEEDEVKSAVRDKTRAKTAKIKK